MKTKIVALILIAALFIVVPRQLLGFSIWHLGSALDVAAALGAKLACSGKYLSNFSDEQIRSDLLSYSPVNQYLDIQYQPDAQRVVTDMLGLASYSATYREATGCSLDIGDTSALDSIVAIPIPSEARPWPKGYQVNTIDSDKQQKLDKLLEQDNKAGLQTRALVLVQNGEIKAESYAPGLDYQSKLLGWSMGKSLTSIMLGRMEHMELADTTKRALFPEWEDDHRSQISLEHLLRMSSGLKFDETYAPGSDSTRMLFLAHSASDVALTGTPEYQPGTHFSYSSGTTNILSRWMYEHLGGTPQASYNFLQQEILSKLNMAHSTFETDPSGVYVGSSYIYASARDWARLGLLMLNKGEFQGEQLLSEDWVNKASMQNPSDNYPAYGYQFWLNQNADALEYSKLPKDAYFMLGNRKQAVMIVPSLNSVVVRLGWTSGEYPMNENFAHILNFGTKSSN
ncbi:serine hydrolase [Paraneptunicella aestuarii]|uniref:serine hydrolase domain-containing protein n=1 Tax=Paraneptunicella aestuarii TaxID=2831148 RepID=UPI001E57ECBE|nr:serine hydrolase [Paraneptunicella aestuarii]UAA40518.1 serine hydrolase [Paraneptunicella aestuarii]